MASQAVEATAESLAGAYTALQAPSASPFIYFRPADTSDLDAVYKLEIDSYPADEAASRKKLDFRIRNANEAFMVAVASGAPSTSQGQQNGASSEGPEQDVIVGFVCGTCSRESRLTHASMSTHEPDGVLLCVHSVVVRGDLRRQGIATRMLKAYLQYVQGSLPHLQAAALLCKQDLIPLYKGAGFGLIGPSDVVHGQDQWLGAPVFVYACRYEMRQEWSES